MKLFDLIPHIALENLSDTLEKLSHYHKKAFKRDTLEGVIPVDLYLTTGRSVRGYIIDYQTKFHSLVLVEVSNIKSGSLKVSHLSLANIESVEIDQFEAVIHLFSKEGMEEGLGEPPTLLSLKKSFQEKLSNNSTELFSKVNFLIDFELFRGSGKSLWALDALVKNLSGLLELDEVNSDFKDAFIESIKEISISPDSSQTISLTDNQLVIAIDLNKGIQGVPKPQEIFDFLFQNL